MIFFTSWMFTDKLALLLVVATLVVVDQDRQWMCKGYATQPFFGPARHSTTVLLQSSPEALGE